MSLIKLQPHKTRFKKKKKKRAAKRMTKIYPPKRKKKSPTQFQSFLKHYIYIYRLISSQFPLLNHINP